jgi:hypothetical protein
MLYGLLFAVLAALAVLKRSSANHKHKCVEVSTPLQVIQAIEHASEHGEPQLSICLDIADDKYASTPVRSKRIHIPRAYAIVTATHAPAR